MEFDESFIIFDFFLERDFVDEGEKFFLRFLPNEFSIYFNISLVKKLSQ